MLHTSFVHAPAKPWSRATSSAYRHAAARARRTDSLAAPLTLAAVVVSGLGLAIASAIAGALGAQL